MKAFANRAPVASPEEQSDGTVSTVWFAPGDNRRDALALRHRGYAHAGLIEHSPFGIYTDSYDDLPTTLIAGLYRRGACIATLRLSVYYPGAADPVLPCENVYPEVASIKAAATGPLVELSRLAIDPDINNTRYRARLYAAAVRTGIAACVALDVAHLIVATQTKWRSTYEHLFGFKVAGPAQLYPPGDVPVVLLQRAVDDEMRRRLSNNLFFKIEDSEIAELRSLLPRLFANGAPQA